MLKLVFAGTPDVAVPSLKAFAADPRFDVVGVITRPDALAAVGEGTATFTAQPAEGLEYAHKITVEDARISWTDEAEAIDRQHGGAERPACGYRRCHRLWQYPAQERA